MSLQQSPKSGKSTGKVEGFPTAATVADPIAENGFYSLLLSGSGDIDLNATVPNGGGNADGWSDGDMVQITLASGDSMFYEDPLSGFTYTFRTPGDIICLCYDADGDQWITTG